MGDSDTDNDGFRVEDNTWFSPSDGAGLTKAQYDSWTWKQIKAAITGAAAVDSSHSGAAAEHAAEVSNPTTLWESALAIRQAKELLAGVGNNLHQQIEALVGEKGSWKGDAATAFKNVMDPFAKAFLAHAEQLDGGPMRYYPAPEQLWAAGNYLEWARTEVNKIDQHYAAEAKRIADAYNHTLAGIFNPVEYQMDGGLIMVSWNQQIVDMMTNDMRRVLKILATEYGDIEFQVDVQKVPIPTPGSEDPPEQPPYPEPPPYPDPPAYDPPEYPEFPEFNPEDYNPEDYNPENYNPENYNPGNYNPEDFNPESYNPENMPGGDPAAYNPESYNPENFTPGDSAGLPGAYTPEAFNPSALDSTGLGPGGDFSAPGATPFESGSPNGLGAMPISPYAGAGGLPGSSNGRALGSSDAPKSYGSGSEVPGMDSPELSGIQPSDMPELEDWAASSGPGSSGMPDERGLGSGMPMMPMAPGAGAGANNGNSERPDAAGLLGGEIKPWEPSDLAGLGDPLGLDTPAVDPADWAAGSGPGSLGMPDERGLGSGMPMMPMAPGAGAGTGNNPTSERPDAAGLLGGEVEPWESSEFAGLGDPEAAATPALDPQEWAAGSGPGSLGMPDERGLGSGMPMMPMAPGAGAGANNGNSERPDAAGLLGGQMEPWESSEFAGLGDPDATAAPALDPQEWAAPGGAGEAAQFPQMPMTPMAPMAPGAGAGANNGNSERPDAAGLLGGQVEPWESSEFAGLGDPDAAAAPALDPQEWAAPGGAGEAAQFPQMPMTPMAPMAPGAGANGGTAERPDAAGLLGGETEAWESAVPGLGEPQAGGDAAPVSRQEWATPAESGPDAAQSPMMPMPPMAPMPPPAADRRQAERSPAAEPVEPGIPEEERVAVVRPADSDEDTSAWDLAAVGGLPWLSAAASRARDEPEREEPAPDYTERETTPWEPAHTSSTAAHLADARPGRVMDGLDFLPRQTPIDDVPTCGGPDDVVPTAENEIDEPPDEANGDDDEAEEERRAADLLTQHHDAWSAAPPKAPGVIE